MLTKVSEGRATVEEVASADAVAGAVKARRTQQVSFRKKHFTPLVHQLHQLEDSLPWPAMVQSWEHRQHSWLSLAISICACMPCPHTDGLCTQSNLTFTPMQLYMAFYNGSVKSKKAVLLSCNN